MMYPNMLQAIMNLKPGCQFSINGESYEGLWWNKDNEFPPPTEEEINQEMERLHQEYERNQYQRNRAKEYPSIQDQLDALYHQGYDGWKAMVDEVKNKYPKPGEE